MHPNEKVQVQKVQGLHPEAAIQVHQEDALHEGDALPNYKAETHW